MLYGKRYGFGVRTYPNGDRYEGDWNVVKEGCGKFTFSNGDIYEVIFKNDKREGLGTYRNKEGNIFYEGEWKNDMKNGYGCYTFEDGTKYEGEYKDDKRVGKGYFIFQ